MSFSQGETSGLENVGCCIHKIFSGDISCKNVTRFENFKIFDHLDLRGFSSGIAVKRLNIVKMGKMRTYKEQWSSCFGLSAKSPCSTS